MADEQIHRHINENADSCEFSTPAKGGAIKIYGDFLDKETFKKKIDAAIEVRAYGASKIGV